MTRLGLSLLFGLAMMPAAPGAFAQAPRTSWGAPDLQAVWNNLTATPLERPAAFDGLTTTEEKAKAFAAANAAAFLADESDGIGGRQSEWWEVPSEMVRINGELRTSIIVEPANGRMPYTDAGRARLTAAQKANFGPAAVMDNPEQRPSPERCLTGGSGSTGAPIFSGRYNGHYRIVQTPGHLVISIEQNNAVRIIPIDGPGKSAAPPAFPRWMGASRGHWEGDALVVETTGFMPGDAYKPAAPIFISDKARVTERFTRLSPGELLYQFTVEDPEVFRTAWRGEQVMRASDERMFEYACHESNHSLPNILSGGRTADARKASPGKPDKH